MNYVVTKQPTMLLDEVTRELGVYPPKFCLLERVRTGPNKGYYYQLKVDEKITYGNGQTRQFGRHDCASKMLELLSVKKCDQRMEYSANITEEQNFVKQLEMCCISNKLPIPKYEVTTHGFKHHSCICELKNNLYFGEGISIKKARQEAAKGMLELIKYPAIDTPINQENYKLPVSCPIDFRAIALAKNKNIATIKLCLNASASSERVLKMIANEIGLVYRLHIFRDCLSPPNMCLVLLGDQQHTFVEFLEDENIMITKTKLIQQVIIAIRDSFK